MAAEWRRSEIKFFHNEENRQIDKEVPSERTVCNFYLQLANSARVLPQVEELPTQNFFFVLPLELRCSLHLPKK